MKWMSKRFTFVVIPDANQTVQRYRVTGLILTLIPITIILLTICSILFIYLFSGKVAHLKDLSNQLASSEENYELLLTERDEIIGTLEADLFAVSVQAEQVRSKLTDISELELQLKEIAGIEDSTVRISSSSPTDKGGTGGEEIPLLSSTTNAKADHTLQNLTTMSLAMDDMKPSLEATIKGIKKYQYILEITPTIWPADSRKITSTFGVRRDPFSGRSSLHSGLDLGGDRGDPIYASANGVITLSENTYPQGNNIIIDHGRGIETRYLHLNKRLVEVGDKVTKGQLIGELGNTGRSTGPHLHYEVIVNGTQVDPRPYIKEDREDK
ncbi:M23 family metallopeptidase [Paenibacillus sp. GSMTC-2017]|uniref:M23 family metallopeptidase n=1 Tax=Paenibacillus sp. GSMTC-2017 TaxID=2794350 RepID=UPI0018D5DA58|nr:M23 family metallopeptidase [Paenibacillus sp. GSMTC-2017]MBH5319934.1 M23 family metallopeptidase [Paenibacillus sp. GSMTC-2017]